MFGYACVFLQPTQILQISSTIPIVLPMPGFEKLKENTDKYIVSQIVGEDKYIVSQIVGDGRRGQKAETTALTFFFIGKNK